MAGKSVKGAAGLAFALVLIAVIGSLIAASINISTAKPLPRFGSCQEMALAFESARQQYQNGMLVNDMVMRSLPMTAGVPMTAGAVKSSETAAPAPSYSTTNIQVAGVDEADIVKTDGNYIYTIHAGSYGYYYEGYSGSSESSLVIAKAYPAEEAAILSNTGLGNFTPNEMFIDGDRLLLFGSDYETRYPQPMAAGIAAPEIYPYYISTLTVQLWDISDRSSPGLLRTVDFEGDYLTSRKIGDSVYFVVNSYPRYYPVEQGNVTPEAVQSMIPLYRDSGSGQDYAPACGCAEVAHFEPVQAEQFLTIASISMSDENAEVEKETIVGSGQNVYASQQSMYVAETVWPLWGGGIMPMVKADGGLERQQTEKTVIYKFGLSNGNIAYQGNGEVKGHVLNQFSMDENNGYFRIATTAGGVSRSGEPLSSNNIYVLDASMKQAGKLEDLAPGEQIHSARFMGDRCYLVTFKKIDPFFVIDLSVPTSPQVLGKLKIPGYSDYLHPYDDNHIIGIGKETVEAGEEGSNFAWYQGIKMAVFDVTDVSNPVEMHKVVIGDRGTDSEVLYDHKAFLFDKDTGLLVLPITLAEIKGDKSELPTWSYGDFVYQGAYVYSLTLDGGFELKGRVTHYDSNETFDKSGYYFGDQDSNVRRSLYIGDVLYTISNAKIKANSLGDLSEIKELKLGAQ